MLQLLALHDTLVVQMFFTCVEHSAFQKPIFGHVFG